mmetsp:Transcript_27166/g.56559  ORF Transcript_27166/g.56559 Transcript_27166/m.56559 type:complete len:197 (+) Transcript_27166:192-782(+)
MTLTKQEAPSISNHRRIHNSADMTMGIDSFMTGRNPNNNRTTITAKKHSHLHRHGNRPRSKSPTQVHKKKISTKRNNPGTHSPTKLSSSTSQQQLQLHGRLWIRPVAVKRNSHPFQPVFTTGNHNHSFTSISSDNLLVNRSLAEGSPLYDEEMMWAMPQKKASFGSLQKRRGSPTMTRINFGESGKPIAIGQRKIF